MPKFKPGQSGNPAGRPKGVKDRRVKYRELLEAHAETLINKAKDLALSGDTTALRLCLERIIPPIKSKDEPVTLEALGGSLTEQGSSIIHAMGNGELSPSEAASMLQALAAQCRIIETSDHEERLLEIEKTIGKQTRE